MDGLATQPYWYCMKCRGVNLIQDCHSQHPAKSALFASELVEKLYPSRSHILEVLNLRTKISIKLNLLC